MLQFPVPQFIDIEDKLIGPLTLKQFGFILPGGLLIFILFRIFGLGITFFLTGIPALLLTLIVGFGQFNGKPLYSQFGVFLNFVTGPKRYQFSKNPGSLDDLNISAINIGEPQNKADLPPESTETPQSKLHRLSLMLDQKNEEENSIVKPEER